MVVSDSAVHEIDLVRWLFGEEVAATSILKPRRSTRTGDGLHDPLIVLLEMASGVLVDVEVFINAGYGYDIRGEIVGEGGTVALADGEAVAVKRDGRRSGRVPADWRERFGRAFDAELQDWLKAVAAGPADWAEFLGRLCGRGRHRKLPGGAADRPPHRRLAARAPRFLREGAVKPPGLVRLRSAGVRLGSSSPGASFRPGRVTCARR